MWTSALLFPEATNSTGSVDICRQHKELAQKPHPPALTKQGASGPVLSTRKPTASGSRQAQRQDSEEEARPADADAGQTGKGKY